MGGEECRRVTQQRGVSDWTSRRRRDSVRIPLFTLLLDYLSPNSVIGLTEARKTSVRPTFASLAETHFQECPYQFIKLLKGDTGINLDSETTSSDVQTYHFRDPDSGRKVTIVEMPCFSGSYDKFSNTDILKRSLISYSRSAFIIS